MYLLVAIVDIGKSVFQLSLPFCLLFIDYLLFKGVNVVVTLFHPW
jgi:hypothetical protein